ncbi:DUF4402 domain-containing protein [Sneathiella marina]|uniref:DUF4402 domain-containing protein n=1 Tax=Sneathiella marina TaxID=2950108 RepID=A0ABY4VXU7_9PROT|nr:DUF4402 domain-containing protein [Sneathiella marina]USG59757.1 DUF4402 domain-containing protein [Sneathiella marina]
MMKILSKKCAYAAIGLGLATAGLGLATSASATSLIAGVSATILETIIINQTAPASFGTIAMDTTTGGTIQLGLADAVDITTTGIIVATGSITSGAFKITGTPSQGLTIDVTPTANPTLTVNSVDTELTLQNIQTNVPAAPALNSSGELDIIVGMDLVVPANAPTGVYSNGTYTVEANYN